MPKLNEPFDAKAYFAEAKDCLCTADLRTMEKPSRLLHITNFTLDELIQSIKDMPPIGQAAVLVHRPTFDDDIGTAQMAALLVE